jgi:hypothetical protein
VSSLVNALACGVLSCCRCFCFLSSSLRPPLGKELYVGTTIHTIPTASTYNTKVRFPNCIVQRVFFSLERGPYNFFAKNNRDPNRVARVEKRYGVKNLARRAVAVWVDVLSRAAFCLAFSKYISMRTITEQCKRERYQIIVITITNNNFRLRYVSSKLDQVLLLLLLTNKLLLLK